MSANTNLCYTPKNTRPHQDFDQRVWCEPWQPETTNEDQHLSWSEAEKLDYLKPLEDVGNTASVNK